MNRNLAEFEIIQNWSKILNLFNDGLMLVRPDGTILHINEALERMVGYTSSEITGRSCLLLNCDACERMVAGTRNAWCSLFDQGLDLSKECVVIKRDGSSIPVIKKAALLHNAAGEVLGAVEIFTDISGYKRLDHELTRLTRHVFGNQDFQGIIGQSAAMRKVFGVIEKAAGSDAPVFISGESGTGKELVAEAIHKLSKRRDGPFVQVNSAALNPALLESELFGHIKGAFTGALQHRMGRFEFANGGSLLLDEIGDLPHAVQVKLLRVLESRKIERVGDQTPIDIDARIISATNKDLKQLIAGKLFREDLFYRINVIPIHLPPLRRRMDDLPLLVNYFVARLQQLTGKPITGLTRQAMQKCMAYSWPGNVRELKAILEYAFVIKDAGLIDLEDLSGHFMGDAGAVHPAPDAPLEADTDEKRALVAALKQALGNRSRAARILGVSRGTVWNRIRKYGIDTKTIFFPEG